MTTTTTYTVPTDPDYYGEATAEQAEELAHRIADAVRAARPDVDVRVADRVPPIERYEPTAERAELDAEVEAIWQREIVILVGETS